MKNFSKNYYEQVSLLIKVLPYLNDLPCFALKGGTAINFFYQNMPRLSVDIDLCYLPLEPRQKSLLEINDLNALRKLMNNQGPSWLTFIGQMKDSLWSIDLFRAESIHLKSHWVMVIIDQMTRRIIGFAVHAGQISGTDVCFLFNNMISQKKMPKYLSSDNDPLFQFHRWQANLRILGIEERKTVPYTPISHPFVERLIGTIRQELLDQILFWNATDLQRKLEEFQYYYNAEGAHLSIDGKTPLQHAGERESHMIPINHYRWNSHCRGLFQLPVAA